MENPKIVNLTLGFPMDQTDKKVSKNKELVNVQTKFIKLDETYWNKLLYLEILLLVIITIVFQIEQKMNNKFCSLFIIIYITIVVIWLILRSYSFYN